MFAPLALVPAGLRWRSGSAPSGLNTGSGEDFGSFWQWQVFAAYPKLLRCLCSALRR